MRRSPPCSSASATRSSTRSQTRARTSTLPTADSPKQSRERRLRASKTSGPLSSDWRATPGLTGPGVALALRAGLRARRDADARRSRPVWTGPSSVGERRLTAAVLHELIATASKRILLVSYAAYTLPELAADLEAAVGRDCEVDVVFETATDSAGQYSGPHRPFGQIAGINRWRWPPEHRPTGAVLHAKLLVIDGHSALIGSANLTDRALHANLEAGLLVHDPEVAAELEGHIR
ncbi:MAG: DISARM system phospholipase D-like protein DrmC, partial [Solirubrobacteraceae bacterium]